MLTVNGTTQDKSCPLADSAVICTETSSSTARGLGIYTVTKSKFSQTVSHTSLILNIQIPLVDFVRAQNVTY
jgi:hypothetical protein